MFDEIFNNEWMPKMKATEPAINVKEDGKAYTMEVAVPGIKKEFCRININNDGNLEVAIENKLEHKEENKKEHFIRREFSYSNYQQTYVLPENVVKEKISAKVENGVLSIVMPKQTKEEEKKSQLQIEVK
ncbi:MAG: Hsp20 family protein [Bacteroidaceae bacterium]|nr:Hsp20 family protein [Bacteroidaceae bacterium]